MSGIYSRPELAATMARQLIHPDTLNEGLRSGLFLSGQRRTGKTTFLRHDLIPALEGEGALVIYVDLWSDTQANPAQLVRDAIRQALEDLQTPGSALLSRLGRISGADVGVMGFRFGFKLDKLGQTGGPTLAQVMTELVDQAKRDVVLIIDEVQQAITTEEGNRLLLALKAARDAVNPRPGTPGHFLFIGTGSHRAMVSELTTRRTQAFNGATSIAFPVLGADYVRHLLRRLASDGATLLPSEAVAVDAFRTLGNRPEEMIKALRQLQWNLPAGSNPDDYLPIVAATLRSAAADIELAKVEGLGSVALAVFARIAAADGDAKGLFSADAVADYARSVGREVRVEEIQPIVNELMSANIIMRRGHGLYGITDPFVQQAWRERQSLFADDWGTPTGTGNAAES
jgi:hypothetical protein